MTQTKALNQKMGTLLEEFVSSERVRTLLGHTGATAAVWADTVTPCSGRYDERCKQGSCTSRRCVTMTELLI